MENVGVIYARFSPGGNQTEQSIEGQVRVCKEFAKVNNLKIAKIYKDEHKTGTNDKRSDFQNMLKDSQKENWNFVLVYAIDRFGRNRIEIAINKYKLKQNNKILLSATQRTADNLDGSKNLDGIILESFYEGYAEYYSEELSQKVKRGQFESIEKKQFLGGPQPFAYDVIDKKLVPNSNRVAILKELVNLFLSGKTIEEILVYTKEKSIYNQFNRPFSKSQVIRLLQNKLHIGILKYGNKEYPNYIQPIISKVEYDEIMKRFNRNKLLSGGGKATVPYLLSLKLVCGNCGANWFGESGTGRNKVYHYYKCYNAKRKLHCKMTAIDKDYIESLVVKETVKNVFIEETMKTIAHNVYKLIEKEKSDNSKLEFYKSELSATEKSINNLILAIENGAFTNSTTERLKELENKKNDLKDQIAIEEATDLKITEDMIYAWLVSQKDGNIENINFRKKIIDTYVNKVFIYPNKLVITYNIDDDINNNEITLDEINGFIAEKDIENNGSYTVSLSPPIYLKFEPKENNVFYIFSEKVIGLLIIRKNNS